MPYAGMNLFPQWSIIGNPWLSLLGGCCEGAELSAPWSYAIIPTMKGRNETVEDDFWTERLPFFTAQFPTFYSAPQQVHGRIHTSDERYFDGSHEIIPLTERRGQRTYVMMHPNPAMTFVTSADT